MSGELAALRQRLSGSVWSLADARGLGLSAGARLVAEAFGRLLQLGLAIAAQRTLGAAGYGEFAYWLDASFVVAAFADLGLQLIVTRELARGGGAATGIARTGLLLKLALSLPAAGLLGALAVLRPPALPAATAALGLAMLFNTFVEYAGYVLRGRGQIVAEAALLTALRVLIAALGLSALAAGLGLAGLAAAYALGAGLTALAGGLWLRPALAAPATGGVGDGASPIGARALLGQALPLGGAIVLSILYTRTAVFMLDGMRGSEAVGVYAVARKFTEPLAIVPAALLAAVFPALTRALAARSSAAGPLQRRTVVLLALAGLAVIAAATLGVPWLIAALYGDTFPGAAEALQLLALATLPVFVNYALTHFLVAQGRQRLILWFNAAILVANAALCWLLIPPLGPMGAAVATVASEALLFGLCALALRAGQAAVDTSQVASGQRHPIPRTVYSIPDRARQGSREIAARLQPRWLLVALALVLPFELVRPVVVLGPIAITNVELALYVLLLAWGLPAAWRLLRRPPALKPGPLEIAVVVWAAIMLVSALATPFERDAALKFALRSAGGCALALAAGRLATTPRRAARVLEAVALGAVLAALVAPAELWLPGAAPALLVFKTQITRIGAFVRASATFEYPNVAAMYWEAALPLVAVLGSLASAGRVRRSAALLAAVGLALAIVLSASRGALLASALVLAALAGASWRSHARLRAPVLAGLIALGAFALALTLANPVAILRLASGDDAGQRVEFHAAPPAAGEVGRAAGAPATIADRRVGSLPAGGLIATPPPPKVPGKLLYPGRLELWSAGLRMWLDHPLLGAGPDNFRHRYTAYLAPGQYDDRLHANSLYVETLATLGLAGLAALGGLVAALVWSARRVLRAPDPSARLLGLGLAAALAAFFVHGAVDTFLAFTPTYGLFWLLAGLLGGLARGEAR